MASRIGSGKKSLTYFTTEKGRKLVFGIVFTVSSGLFIGNYFPHTFALSKYKDFVQAYSSGIERTLPEKIIVRYNKALDLVHLSQFERNLITPFAVFGFDVFHAGSSKYKQGGILGVPVNYNYSDPNDINRAEILLRNEMIDWSTENGKLLEKSLVLTEDEQIFSMARAILELHTHKILLNAVYPCAASMVTYTIANAVNQRLNLYARPFSLRLIMYSIVGLFGFGLWCFLKDYTQVKIDAVVDKQLCELGPDIMKVGISFYEKLLNKNIALRGLTKDDTYTAKGNFNYLLRQKSMPLTFRKEYLEMRLNESLNIKNTDSNDTNTVSSDKTKVIN